MGIPFYFKSIVKQYPNIIAPYKSNLCKYLFLDYNSLIHNAAQCVLKEHKHYTDIEQIIIDKCLKMTSELVTTFKPTTMLYIAVDGLCPRAKMNQQRKRRYMSAWRNQRLQDCRDKLNIMSVYWDTNAITPGTHFMKKLDEALQEWAHQQKHLHVLVSPSSEVGEGEHKIFKFLNNEQSINDDQNDILIYGLDADLIMLSLINKQASKICLVRDKPAFNIPIKCASTYLKMNINELSKSLFAKYQSMLSNDIDCMQFTRDYIVLCSLLGNDFIPPLSCLKIKQNGIDVLIDTYVKQGVPLTTDNEVNVSVMSRILSSLARHEDVLMKEACEIYYRPNHRYTHFHSSSNCPIESLSFEIDNYPTTCLKFPQHLINPQQKTWKDSYYSLLFHKDQQTLKACKQYIEGLQWVAKYYFDYDNASQTWYYKYNYSPLMTDLSEYLTNLLHHNGQTLESINMNVSHTSTIYSALQKNPELQLLMVLPPASINLLSHRAKLIMSKIEHGCCHLFPIAFKISTFLKSYMWECSPCLPNINLQYLVDQYNLVKV